MDTDSHLTSTRSALNGVVLTALVVGVAAAADRAITWAGTLAADTPGAASAPSGDLWALSLVASNLVGIGALSFVLVFAGCSRSEPRSLAYRLGIVPVPLSVIIRWTAIFIAVSVAGEGVLQLLGLPADAAPLMRAYTDAVSLPLLALAVAGTAPLFEELLLRGFLFGRIASSSVGTVGAVVVTASAWALLHLQYSVGAFVFVAALALVFSLARARTGSVVPSLFLHVLNNVGLLLQTIVWAR